MSERGLTRRELFGWLRRRAAPSPAPTAPAPIAPAPIAVPVLAPVWLADDAPFSLDAFYAARAEARKR